MISDLKEMRCEKCGRKSLSSRERIEDRNGDIFWYVKCNSCGRQQEIWMIEGENAKERFTIPN